MVRRSYHPRVTTLSLAAMSAETLDKCDEVLTELHEQCCEPNRSPRMQALVETLTSIRSGIENLEDNPDVAETILEQLESAGAEIGRLQIACCAPARMPLYSELLAGLSRTQRMVTATQDGMEH